MEEERLVKVPAHIGYIQPAEAGWGFTLKVKEEESHSALTSAFGQMFHGVEIPEGANDEDRQVALFMCQEWLRFLNKIGYYEHTADWDLYAAITLYDGRHTHTSGVWLDLDPVPGDNDYAGQPVGRPIHAVLNGAYAWKDGTDTPEDRSLFPEFGRDLKETEEEVQGDLYIPIGLISKVEVGWD